MPTQLTFLAASTFAGRLVLNLAYDAPRVPPEVAAGLAESVRERIAIAAG